MNHFVNTFIREKKQQLYIIFFNVAYLFQFTVSTKDHEG